MKDKFILTSLLVLIVANVYGIFSVPRTSDSTFGEATRVCTVTQSVVTVGNQFSTQILAKGSRQWAIIQQPTNATNTVALSFDNASSTMARGYTLAPDVTPDVASTTDKVVIGFATDLPTSNAVEAITSTGSTTLRVIECK